MNSFQIRLVHFLTNTSADLTVSGDTSCVVSVYATCALEKHMHLRSNINNVFFQFRDVLKSLQFSCVYANSQIGLKPHPCIAFVAQVNSKARRLGFKMLT